MHHAAKNGSAEEARFVKGVIAQIVGPDGGFPQGHFCCTARGKSIGGAKTRWWGPLDQYLQAALADYPKSKEEKVFSDPNPAEAEGEVYGAVRLPEGAVVVDVMMKMVGDFQPPITVDMGHQEKVWRNGVGEDRLWIRKDEADQLAQGTFPESLKRRLADYHLFDLTRGQTGAKARWPHGTRQKVEVTLSEGRLKGKICLESPKGDQGYEADLLGFIEAKGGKLTRFDLLVKGWWHNDWWFEYCELKVPPKTKRVLAVAFRLNEETGERRAFPPPGQAYRGLNVYLR